jgi:hypothetical protein
MEDIGGFGYLHLTFHSFRFLVQCCVMSYANYSDIAQEARKYGRQRDDGGK